MPQNKNKNKKLEPWPELRKIFYNWYRVPGTATYHGGLFRFSKVTAGQGGFFPFFQKQTGPELTTCLCHHTSHLRIPQSKIIYSQRTESHNEKKKKKKTG